MTTVIIVPERKTKDVSARSSLARAMRDLVKLAGGQDKAAALIGIKQSRVSLIARGMAGAEIETLVGLRAALGRSIDDILGLPPVGAEPGDSAPLDQVLTFYRGRWDGLPLDLASLRARADVPRGGWKAALDDMAARLGAPKRDDLARPRAVRAVASEVAAVEQRVSARSPSGAPAKPRAGS